jgi:hypothetical protein
MRMQKTIVVLNGMVDAGVIKRYAISGAVAAYNYIEASVTEDLDILVSFDEERNRSSTGLLALGPIINHLAGLGYTEWHKEGLIIGDWPVQFLPVASDLDAEALEQALETQLEMSPGAFVQTRILRAEHLVAIALKVSRPKDRLRVVAFLTEHAVEPAELCALLERHGLSAQLQKLCDLTGISNPCVLSIKP